MSGTATPPVLYATCPGGGYCLWTFDGADWSVDSTHCLAPCSCNDPNASHTDPDITYDGAWNVVKITLAKMIYVIQNANPAHFKLIKYQPSGSKGFTAITSATPEAFYSTGDEYQMPCYK